MNISDEVFSTMHKTGIIPVITLENHEDAEPLAKALASGGINIAEITYRTKAASKSIALLREKCPDILAGAGTIITMEQAKEAVECGARFIVSPGFSPDIAEYCMSKGIAVIPGVFTPSEITLAARMGIKVQKLFPAELAGGPAFLDAMKGPFPDIKFIPTGGITAENAEIYSKRKNVLAVGGSWIVRKEFISERKWDIITAEAEKALILTAHKN